MHLAFKVCNERGRQAEQLVDPVVVDRDMPGPVDHEQALVHVFEGGLHQSGLVGQLARAPVSYTHLSASSATDTQSEAYGNFFPSGTAPHATQKGAAGSRAADEHDHGLSLRRGSTSRGYG